MCQSSVEVYGGPIVLAFQLQSHSSLEMKAPSSTLFLLYAYAEIWVHLMSNVVNE